MKKLTFSLSIFFLVGLSSHLPAYWGSSTSHTYATHHEFDHHEQEALELEVHELVNNFRASIGLPPMNYNAELANIARQHSKNMADGLIPDGHAGYDERQKRILHTLGRNARGDFGIAENVAKIRGYSNPLEQAVVGWSNSPSHLENMVDIYNYSGVGVEIGSDGSYYITHLFMYRQ